MAAPFCYNEYMHVDVFSSILNQWIASRNLEESITDHGVSTWAFYRARAENPVFAKLHAQARKAIADTLAAEILSIADHDPDAQRAKNRISARTWVASRYHREEYGDQVDVTVNGSLDVSGTLLEARRRVRPVSDQLEVSDAQVIEEKGRQALPVPGSQPGAILGDAPLAKVTEPNVLTEKDISP
jgi:hypothetical protein